MASLTTINTPHNGSMTMDKLMKLPAWLMRLGCRCADGLFRIWGDKEPDTYQALRSFTTTSSAKFNCENPDDERVYYQSYAFVMRHPGSDIFMWLPSLIVGIIEGENDGLLTPEAVRWANFRGVYRGVGRRGISHCDEIDLRRRPLSKKKGAGVSDIVEVYKEIVQGLAERGF